MRDDEAVRERSRTRDICGDNGLMILIFTYLVVRQETGQVAAQHSYYDHSPEPSAVRSAVQSVDCRDVEL